MPSVNDCDLLVIGSGPAGSTVARRCARRGWRVALAESREFGGTCALRGCNPKKVLVRAAELVDWARRGDGRLARGGANVSIDWANLIRFKREFTDPVARTSEERFRADGITTLSGLARFRGRDEVQIDEHIVRAKHIVIAAGARPAPIDAPGEHFLTTSDKFLELESLPRRICFIGGGYISFEFAHVAARAGADVTIVDRHERPLKNFDPDLVDLLVDRSRGLGVNVIPRAELLSIERRQRAYEITLRRDRAHESLSADLVVHGAGRVPNLEGLNLDAGGISYGDQGIEVDEYLQSVSNPIVFAAGDCVATPVAALTPCANEHARVIRKNLLEAVRLQPDYGVIPTVVFTVPALAACGLTEAAAREQNKDYEVREGDMSEWGSVRKVCEPCAAYKVLVERGTDRILGVHLLGPAAAETINLFAVAMKGGMTATELKSVLMAFPTFASDVRRMI